MATDTILTDVPTLVGGNWQTSSSAETAHVYNPSTGKVIARVPLCEEEETLSVIEAATAALPDWSETPAVERARVMFKFRDLIEQNFAELAALVTREHGKTLPEARAEVQRGLEMVEFACGVPSLLMGGFCGGTRLPVAANQCRYVREYRITSGIAVTT